MKKMIKGAAVAGLGVALLLGGGGTLAYWNAEVQTDAGQIVAGDLDLTAAAGSWTSNLRTSPINISTYKVVPGETLTYTQPLTVTLEGDKLAATLTVDGTGTQNGFDNNVTVTTTLNGEEPGLILAAIADNKTRTLNAVTTFEFKSSTDKRRSVGATYDFSKISYKLAQNTPVAGEN